MTYARTIEELESHAILWWPEHLNKKNTSVSVIPRLLQTQDDFLNILSLSKEHPLHVLDILRAAKYPANLFLKHLCVLSDYGGEPIQRLGRAFSQMFQNEDGSHSMTYVWEAQTYEYQFKVLPLCGLGNKKLWIDGDGLTTAQPLSDLFEDMIILMMFGSTSTKSEEAGLTACEIGTLLGKKELLEHYVKQRYINVSRITGGATANTLGQLAQREIVDYLVDNLGAEFSIQSNGTIILDGYDKPGGMPFDIVVEKDGQKVGIEVSFQVTTNSTIERKAGQSADRMALMHNNGYKIAYVLDGAGNFQRKAAITTICQNSDCTVAYSEDEFLVLSNWLEEVFD